MYKKTLMAGILAGALVLPLCAQAQGITGGAQQGIAVGNSVAGPPGAAVGAVVGGVVGGVIGGVVGVTKGVLGANQANYYPEDVPPAPGPFYRDRPAPRHIRHARRANHPHHRA
jgi:hypothetical protein